MNNFINNAHVKKRKNAFVNNKFCIFQSYRDTDRTNTTKISPQLIFQIFLKASKHSNWQHLSNRREIKS